METRLDFIINHVFLPPVLPQQDDWNALDDAALLEELFEALKSFQADSPEEEQSIWTPCVNMVKSMLEMRDTGGKLDLAKLESWLRNTEGRDILALHIRGQNAGLIIRKLENQYSFESFEVSPTSSAVIQTKGRLLRCFPGPAVAVSRNRMDDVSFREPLEELLAKLDSRTPPRVCPVTVKASSTVMELRDTIDPQLVTEMLFGILRAVGQPGDVPRIHKHTRDDIQIANSLLPWRRSPLWLLVRVALQTNLVRYEITAGSHFRYKSFMIFFMAQILKNALQVHLSSDLLFVMTAKISRRLQKLSIPHEMSWFKEVKSIMSNVHKELTQKWHDLENNCPQKPQWMWDKPKLSFINDVRLTLPTLQPYLLTVASRSESHFNENSWTPDCCQRVVQSSSSLPDTSLLGSATKDEDRLALFDIEIWVQDHLASWLSNNIDFKDVCQPLAALISKYIDVATSIYKGNPENISAMLLTAIDLWVALDKLTAWQYPLLLEYSPGFEPGLFEPLLLPKKGQMDRLLEIERYLVARRKRAISDYHYVFSQPSTGKEKSLAVRFFDQSPRHKDLKEKIVSLAEQNHSAKLSELMIEREKYYSWMQDAEPMTCDNPSFQNNRFTIHSRKRCSKCRLEKRAADLKIEIYEWPLPADDLEAKLVVFELDVPPIISHWRDTTYGILVDTFSVRRHNTLGSARKLYPYRSYDGLKQFCSSQESRLRPMSTTKPFTVTHYKEIRVFQATQQDVCVNNGLTYGLYDSKYIQPTQNFLGYCDIREKCTSKLPYGRYQLLRYALENTSHTSNKIIADQSKCPDALTLHEFYSFGCLRAGHRLQWRNIVRELSARVLNFGCEETYSLMVQAMWQVGPFDKETDHYDSHVDLEEPEFGASLLSALSDALGSIECNWQGATAARIFIVAAARLLSFSTSNVVTEKCFRFLRAARDVALQWTRDLNQQAQECTSEKALTEINARIFEMALTCHSTFDVDRHYILNVLNTDRDAAILYECCIVIHDRCPAVPDNLPPAVKNLFQRYLRLSHLLEPFLRAQILRSRTGLDDTIHRLWADYQPGSPWSVLLGQNNRWIVSEMVRNELSISVHYNLLDGSLLVSGSPLVRLPRSYELHPMYGRLFGKKILDVVPSTMRGMTFGTRNEIFGYRIYFRMDDSELVIRASRNGQEYELLPDHHLKDDFPTALVDNFVHWLNTETGSIEWRPLTDPWTYLPDNWQMPPATQGARYLQKGPYQLIDKFSDTAKTVSSILGPLEDLNKVHIMLNSVTGTLKIDLPRLKLVFFMRKGTSLIESKEYRGMVVDENQSFGALTGLENKLVLRDIKSSSRSVIIPFGSVSYSQENDHVRVKINTKSLQHVPHHVYRIDEQLRRLVDNDDSLKSKLFKIYLHALTSHCQKDELTARTGTEEAIYGLRSASTRSFFALKQDEVELLRCIAMLTPHRDHYPSHLKVAQTVEWSDLPFLSQHHSFEKLVRLIFNQAKGFLPFHNVPIALPPENSSGEGLLERAAIRNSAYCVDDYGAEDYTTTHDVSYTARDCRSSNIEAEICRLAELTDQWSVDLNCSSNLLAELEGLGKPLCGLLVETTLRLEYELAILEEPVEFLANNWCKLQTILSESTSNNDKYRIMIFLSTLIHSQDEKISHQLIYTLLAFATVPELRLVRPPSHAEFDLSKGYRPDKQKLFDLVKDLAQPDHKCPEYTRTYPVNDHQDNPSKSLRRRCAEAKRKRIFEFVDCLMEQWPRRTLYIPPSDWDSYILLDEATSQAQKWFNIWLDNEEFRVYVNEVQRILKRHKYNGHEKHTYSFYRPAYSYSPTPKYVTFEDLIKKTAPKISSLDVPNFDDLIEQKKENMEQKNCDRLKSLLTRLLSESSDGHNTRYANDLMRSFDSLQDEVALQLKELPEDFEERLEEIFKSCEANVNVIYRNICDCLNDDLVLSRQIVCEAEMWPRLSPISLLQRLAMNKIDTLPEDWKRCLLQYGLAISELQRAKRLISCMGNSIELLAELMNPGHIGWDPAEYPEWLLLEIENNILIRPAQARIALEMISPSSKDNSIMQLNMGEGKSSVIIPIVAAVLADQKKLVRIVVLKSLANQMSHTLLQKLGGMLNRRIFYMPFSRSLQLNEQQAISIWNHYKECMSTGGVLLVQPEHLLSFEMMGFDKLLVGQQQLGSTMSKIQRWLDTNSRDILDESDEILSVRFELVYTMGTQRNIDFSPERWLIVQHVLGVVAQFAEEVSRRHAHGLELSNGCPGSFPRIRILETSAGDLLLAKVARKICDVGLPGLPIYRLPSSARDVLFEFLTKPDMSEVDAEPLTKAAFGTSLKNALLLLRGLIAGGILAFALKQKRWRVNYGLDLSRTMLAVPYRAKDCPAARAEFSHPDATIVLTCLSYYYSGLSDYQMQINFEFLHASDQAQEEYETWIQDAPELPVAFRQLTGINLRESIKCTQELFPPLRFAKGAIDFYLSHAVFPKELKEFPQKLSSSGWDLARKKAHPTTGFSGTNDSRYILSPSISQHDLPQFLHTNATVLGYLLQPENTYKQACHESFDSETLLKLVGDAEPKVRVILDVGAQVLELGNFEIASKWLSITPASEAQAVVFFDDSKDDLCVLNRAGVIEPLLISQFLKQMDQCLVYLDEARTRGTDLKLPTNYRAAVTLGPSLTKDRLVQACMRMRKLGKGQSIMFCATMEVQRKILQCSHKKDGDMIEVSDVLRWSIAETCINTRKCVPLWATQGLRHLRRQVALYDSSDDEEISLERAESLLEPEARSIDARYGFTGQQSGKAPWEEMNDESFSRRTRESEAILAKCREFGIVSISNTAFEEEQERELSPEEEKEQQVEHPPPMTPCKHTVHPAVRRFVEEGVLDRCSDAFIDAFGSLKNTSAGDHLDAKAWASDLLVTRDFSMTVKHDADSLMDYFLRPVHWIISYQMAGGTTECVIVSPYEANELLPVIRASKAATLHTYFARVNLSTPTVEDLSFCSIPPVPKSWTAPPIVRQLNLFAGQLYIKSYDGYVSICRFLGLCYCPPGRDDDGNEIEVECDGFVSVRSRGKFDSVMEVECPFSKSPVKFLRELTMLRRRGHGIRASHMGAILQDGWIGEERFKEI